MKPEEQNQTEELKPLPEARGSATDYGVLADEMRQWLDAQFIDGENIGVIRRKCFLPWDSKWNALVREETAAREKSPNEKGQR